MASTNRNQSHTVAWLEQLQKQPHMADFFGVLRRFENIYPDKPRIGESVRASEDAIHLKQTPSLAFAPSSISSFIPAQKNRKDELHCYFFGLFGPNGPLPQHLTEFAQERQKNHRDPAFVEFANLFNHRMLCLLYRAWARSQPTLGMDRPKRNPFDLYLGSLIGLGAPAARQRSALNDHSALYRAGIFALQTRPATGLQSLLSDYLQCPVKINEFIGKRLAIGETNHLHLGLGTHKRALAQDAVLGSSIWDCQSNCRVIIGPLDFAGLQNLLPKQRALAELVALVRLYLGDQLDWDLDLLLESSQVPTACLGKGHQLGLTSWLGHWRQPETPAKVRFKPSLCSATDPNRFSHPTDS